MIVGRQESCFFFYLHKCRVGQREMKAASCGCDGEACSVTTLLSFQVWYLLSIGTARWGNGRAAAMSRKGLFMPEKQ